MALQHVRHASVFVGTKKVGECFKSDTELKSGDEPQIGDDGFQGMSDGAAMSELDFDTFVPVKGMTVSIEQLVATKQDVDLATGLINGKIWQMTGRFTSCKFASDAKAGTQVGTFHFTGSVPSFT